jgi:hypothetical protein
MSKGFQKYIGKEMILEGIWLHFIISWTSRYLKCCGGGAMLKLYAPSKSKLKYLYFFQLIAIVFANSSIGLIYALKKLFTIQITMLSILLCKNNVCF